MPLTFQAERKLLAELLRLSAEREASERRRQSDYEEHGRRATQQFRDLQQGITKRYRTEKEAAEREYQNLSARANAESEARSTEARKALNALERRTAEEFAATAGSLQKELENETWETGAIFDSQKKGPRELVEQTEAQVRTYLQQIEVLAEGARNYIRECRFASVLDTPAPEAPDVAPTNCADQLRSALLQTAQRLATLQQLTVPRLFAGARLAAVYIPLLLIAVLPVLIFFQFDRLGLLAAAAGAVIAISTWLALWLRRGARRRVSEIYTAIQSYQVAARSAGETLVAATRAQAEQDLKRLAAQRDRDLQAARDKFERSRNELIQRRDTQLAKARQENERVVHQAMARREELLRAAEHKYPPLLEQIQTTYRTSLEEAQHQFDTAKSENDAQYQQDWNELVSQWRTGMRQLSGEIADLKTESDRLFPPWTDEAWEHWQPAAQPPSAIRFGQLTVDMRQVEGGISQEPILNEGVPPEFTLPALLDFPQAGSLLVQAAGAGRGRGIDLLQTVMLRMLTTIPPGKVRFTIIDPVGLGESFAGFMHLADYDDLLVTSRIWTEPGHIEQRLADLTEQMENIIQKYLRNEFKTIDEYNAYAGEVAEPFRVLVIANFPVNFSEAAARRLVSIITSGARCGVYTLLLVDANQAMPPGFDLNDVAPYCTCLLWRDGEFIWRDAELRPFRLTVDTAPDEARFTDIVRMTGESAKDSRRVEVPFEHVAPTGNQVWAGSTLHGFDVPLGRAGATKLQRLRLGHGTSQHVLVAGKTGSGKSTLLHALVTNLSLTYSPEEVELYLIDFKKGVEFKTYATHELPHARVVAIESEREFGLSVLQRLDAELRHRGDLFRAAGVQDLASYRQASDQNKLPRILLVVDEFHELFVEDDKIAQDAALLLDRLVRQGRAFGVHVLLGSQTLGGAYSLARSTIGQMGVRIALQCSEADAHLILSEDNTAARLLSRPGEAIYNDAGGLIEGNNPFQVVWLSDERREHYLEKIRALAAQVNHKRPRQIVFEGNAPSDIRRNERLAERVTRFGGDAPFAAPTAWLGEAVAIKEPTAAVFRRENGCNLLMVGQREETASAMMAAILLAVATQRPVADSLSHRSGAQFYVLESPRAGVTPSRTLGSLAAVIPHAVRVISRRDIAPAFDELATEIDRRHADDSGNYPEVYLLVNDLGRFRDLQRDENDVGFSFSGEEKKPSPQKRFSTVLRNGPSVGVFTIVWCDTVNNLNRSIDRQGLREFDQRVLFQMSANDSSFLADTPVASKLGPQLALFTNEEAGLIEKFRPYAWPPAEWLEWVKQQLRTAKGAVPRAISPSAT